MIKQVYKKLGDSLAKKGQREKALEWYRKAGDQESIGDILVEMGNHAQAIEPYASIQKFDKAAFAALNAGQGQVALSYFRKTADIERL